MITQENPFVLLLLTVTSTNADHKPAVLIAGYICCLLLVLASQAVTVIRLQQQDRDVPSIILGVCLAAVTVALLVLSMVIYLYV